MWDYDYLREMSRDLPTIVKYGTTDSTIEGQTIKSEPFLEVNILKGAETGSIKTQLVGDYNLPNVLAAVTVGKHFNVIDKKLKSRLKTILLLTAVLN